MATGSGERPAETVVAVVFALAADDVTAAIERWRFGTVPEAAVTHVTPLTDGSALFRVLGDRRAYRCVAGAEGWEVLRADDAGVH